MRVKPVAAESPAGRAGERRGWRIVKINESDAISTSNTDFVVQNLYQSRSGTFVFQESDNSSLTITPSAGTYHDHPVIRDTVLQQGSKKIGYPP